jgi:lysyl-tRNA synthetase class 1
MYEKGKYTEVIKEALQNKEKIKEILEKISGRKIPEGWSPFRVLCEECGRMTTTTITELLLDQNEVKYECECGNSGNADFSKGEGKLLWRIDWAARWKMLGVNIEPYGKDHGTKGGSYDTAVAMSKDVFKYEPPYGFMYDFIYLKGKKGKMASSTGNMISVAEILSVVPPEIIRYIILKSKPQQFIQFDPGNGLLQAVDEFVKLGENYKKKKISESQKRLYEISEIKGDKEKILVTFRHLVNVVQAACGSIDEIIRILNRTGIKVNKDNRLLQEEIDRVQKWISEYAPENVKFEIQNDIPDEAKKLSDKQKELLKKIAEELEKESDPEKLHNFIYKTGKNFGLSPAETFKPIYIVILGKDYGPKAGWFLVTLDKNFVIKRFKEVTNA